MNQHRPLLKRLVISSVFMFAFAFALVPLYDVFCQVTGLNGKPSMEKAPISDSINTTQQVDVNFLTHAKEGSPFKVNTKNQRLTVNIGEMNKVSFIASNLSNQDRVFQAIPSVSPGVAAQYLHKVQCFCFEQQALKANENIEMTLLFYIDEALPIEIEEMTLSYTLFDITDNI
ncbi:cytochrome c oxidase assembly protein [Psychromonas hadalis]|uniref:cytochrome c oxidase assembly protein n=1 Tax=Psychromonas hadalis TaxID=211669 RepID=UPI0003B7551F|nr:cytochrome c oxidase assembly protein [Psychromonas hadalis]